MVTRLIPMKRLWTGLTQIANQVILEFPNRKEARTFYDIWIKDNHRNPDPAEIDVRLDDIKVFLIYRSTKDAKIRATILIGPDKINSCEYHPLESQGKRCKSCG